MRVTVADVVAVPPVEVVAARVHALLTDHLHLDAASVDTDLIDGGLLDSFAMVELMAAIEEHLGVEIDLGSFDVDDFRSARSIAALIVRQDPGAAGRSA